MTDTEEAKMVDLTLLTDDELAEMGNALERERARRLRLCCNCGEYVPAWQLHICTPNGGANIPLESDEARLLTRRGPHD